MDRLTLEIQQTVQEVLQDRPGAARAFHALGTACGSCTLARFCTLQDVAATYGIPRPVLLEGLQAAIAETISIPRSKQ
jgi:hypothetical protein